MKRFFFNADAGGGTPAASGGEPAAGATLLSGTPAVQSAAAPVDAGPTWFSDAKTGALDPNWLNNLPPELRTEASLRTMPGLTELAKSYVETKKMVGTKLQMPGEGATPEALASWRKVTGAPDAPEGYLGEAKSLRPDSVPETLWNPEGEKAFLAIAHKHGLPPAAVKEIIGFHAAELAASSQASEQLQTQSMEAEGAKLKTAFGANYDTEMANASRMAQTLGLDPKTNPIFANADVVKAMAGMAKLISGDKLVAGEAPGLGATLASKAAEITDPKATSQIAREYRGEFGPERQAAAQAQLHQFMAAAGQK